MILGQPRPGGSLNSKQPKHWGCFFICSLRPMQLLLFDGKTQDFSPPLSSQDHPSPWAQLHCAWSEYDKGLTAKDIPSTQFYLCKEKERNTIKYSGPSEKGRIT